MIRYLYLSQTIIAYLLKILTVQITKRLRFVVLCRSVFIDCEINAITDSCLQYRHHTKIRTTKLKYILHIYIWIYCWLSFNILVYSYFAAHGISNSISGLRIVHYSVRKYIISINKPIVLYLSQTNPCNQKINGNQQKHDQTKHANVLTHTHKHTSTIYAYVYTVYPVLFVLFVCPNDVQHISCIFRVSLPPR